MATYHNAVSDKLVVSFFPKNIFFQVYSKDHRLKWNNISAVVDEVPFELQGAMFSKTTCISASENLVLTPLDDVQDEAHFKLNFKQFNFLTSDNLSELKVVHDITVNTTSLISKLVNPSVNSDVTIAFEACSQRGLKNALYFYEINSTVSIILIQDGKLHLINRYPAENQEELFYYVMLVVEQLEVSLENLHFECLATKGQHENYYTLFKNYMPKLQLTAVDTHYNFLNEDKLDLKSEFLQASFFAQCVL